ncbi:MAG TPA: class I SAM-dependent methyltransferase [Bryobacteraceae bacterium]|nr:class I SAM-dependent methyltransferase [Bryobacteraceae bacterium]
MAIAAQDAILPHIGTMNWKRIFGSRGQKHESVRLTPELRARIQASFDEASGDEEHFPSTIDRRIWHVKLIREHMGPLAGKRVLDVGCGKGRFARVLLEEQPEAEIWGLDLSEEMLHYVPAAIHTRAGSMTELPFEDGFFDGAYATESLEHAVEIEKAVAEICRVVKPGGHIAIIDKNAEHWGQLATPEWERWFTPKELERLLRRHCREVSSRYISYWEDVAPDGLFVAWTAVK